MYLKDFKNHISSFPEGTWFNNGISRPFSWRGVCEEVAFSIEEAPMSREEVLIRIDLAYNETFFGYKGGEYRYDDKTFVNFEKEGNNNYSGGDYTLQMINKFRDDIRYQTEEEKLVRLAFY